MKEYILQHNKTDETESHNHNDDISDAKAISIKISDNKSSKSSKSSGGISSPDQLNKLQQFQIHTGCNHEVNEEDFVYKIPDLNSSKEKALIQLKTVSVICLCFMLTEVVGGVLANSLAIMTDAAHLFSDISGFFISIFSIYLTKYPATNQMSYGYHRAETIGALASIVLIWGLTIWLIWEAISRIIDPPEVNAEIMLFVSILGLLFNITMMKVLHGGHSHCKHHNHHTNKGHDLSNYHINYQKYHDEYSQNEIELNDIKSQKQNQKTNCSQNCENYKDTNSAVVTQELDKNEEKQNNKNEDQNNQIVQKDGSDSEHSNYSSTSHKHQLKIDNLNVKAAFIHVLGDAIQSVGVIIAALIIFFGGQEYNLVDPICTFIFSIIVVFTTVQVAKDCVVVLMEGTPLQIEIDSFKEKLMKIDGVLGIHDLHVWSLSEGRLAMSAHILSSQPSISMKKATLVCKIYGIYHSTLQIENTEEKNIYDFDKCTQLH